MKKTVAVLAVQGAFIEHERCIQKLGCTAFEIRKAEDALKNYDALILPGGESTTQSKLLVELGIMDTLVKHIREGLPVLGTCAGLILLAERLEDAEGNPDFPEKRLATLDVTARRNAYGRQLGSFHAEAPLDFAEGEPKLAPMTFIRAPYIASVGPKARACATVDGRIVAARQGNQLGVAFHPELDDNQEIHKLLVDLA